MACDPFTLEWDPPYILEGFEPRLSMVLILPRVDTHLSQVEGRFAADTESFMDALAHQTVQVFLPRFKLRWQRYLKRDLPALGIRKAFGSLADFSRMSQERLHIEKVVHQAWLSLDEQGAEAAAATGVVLYATLGPSKPAFIANRPFIFAIRDIQSGLILFMGRLVDPRDTG